MPKCSDTLSSLILARISAAVGLDGQTVGSVPAVAQ